MEKAEVKERAEEPMETDPKGKQEQLQATLLGFTSRLYQALNHQEGGCSQEGPLLLNSPQPLTSLELLFPAV